MKKGIRKRYRVLAGLLLAVSAALIIMCVRVAISYSEIGDLVAYRLSDAILILLLCFVPIYLGTVLVWFIVTKCMDLIVKRNAAAREDDPPAQF